MTDGADTGHEQEATQTVGKVLRMGMMIATQMAQHRARVRQQREHELERQARETQAAAEAAERELAAAESAQQRQLQQAARDKAAAARDAARDKLYADRERHQTARRIAEYQLNRVDRDAWWDKATPDAIATAYRQAQEWREESGAAINAAEVIEERVRKDKGIDLAELSDQDLDTALAEAYMTPRERAQREAERRAGAQRTSGPDSAFAQAVAVSLVKDADREDAQIDADIEADGGPSQAPAELSPVAAAAREEIRAMLAKKSQTSTPGASTSSPLLNLPPTPDRDNNVEQHDRPAPLLDLPHPVRQDSNTVTSDEPAASLLNMPDPTTGQGSWGEVAEAAQQVATGPGLDSAAALLARDRAAPYDSAERRENTETWVRQNTDASEEAISARMSADLSSAHPPAAAVGAAAKVGGSANRTGQVRNLTQTHNKQQHQSR